MGLGFVLLIGVIAFMAPTEKIHWLWLFSCVFFFTVGELYLSPIGLSFVSKVSPAKIVSMMMGVWLMSSFFGNYLAGYLGTYYEKMSHQNFFGMMVILSGASCVVLLALAKPVRKITGGHSN